MTAAYTGPDRRTVLAADAAGAHSQRKAAEERAALAEQQRDELHTALRHMTNEYIRTRRALNGDTAEQCESIVCVGAARRAMAKATGGACHG